MSRLIVEVTIRAESIEDDTEHRGDDEMTKSEDQAHSAWLNDAGDQENQKLSGPQEHSEPMEIHWGFKRTKKLIDLLPDDVPWGASPEDVAIDGDPGY